jgi:hypothetical protein
VNILGTKELGIFPTQEHASYFLRFCTLKCKVVSMEAFIRRSAITNTISYLAHKRFLQQVQMVGVQQKGK